MRECVQNHTEQLREILMQTLDQLYDNFYEMFISEKLLVCTFRPIEFDSTTTSKLAVKITFASKAGKEASCVVTPDSAPILHRLFESVAGAKQVPILGHGLKDLFTLFQRLNGRRANIKNVYDLQWYESYLNLDSSENDYHLMLSNFKNWLKNDNLVKIYKSIYAPLICQILPDIESFSFLNEETNKLVFPTYKLEGQENGRLSCICSKKRSYNPHSLGEDKKNYKLHLYGNTIYQFDYKNMEVSVLAALSKDERLLEIINGEKDVYENIFEIVSGCKNIADARSLGKKMFLPVIYGQTPTGMSKSLDISIDQAQIYFNKLANHFQKAFAYVESFQDKAKQFGEVEDYFGRKRSVKIEEAYKARNFAIQSPAALICLESLVKLEKEKQHLYKIAFHVHDGYFLACKQSDMLEVYHQCKKSLESKSEFMPDVKLTVSAKVGKNLEKMHFINRKVET